MSEWSEETRKTLESLAIQSKACAAALAELDRLKAARDYHEILGQSAKVWMERAQAAEAELDRRAERIAELEKAAQWVVQYNHGPDCKSCVESHARLEKVLTEIREQSLGLAAAGIAGHLPVVNMVDKALEK